MLTVSPQASDQEIRAFVDRAKQTYDDLLAAKLGPAERGKIVAIEPESGDYFLGADEVEAAQKARAAGCEAPLYFVRVGYRYAHRLMTPRS